MPSPRKREKIRLDLLLVARGLAETRQKAQAMILAGRIRIGSQKQAKAGTQIPADAAVEVTGQSMPFVSRGGLKLEGAMDDFGVDVAGRICLDVGSSTGGFTDCLLQRGARCVYAVDVTTEQLAWKLRKDKRVVQVKRNARTLQRSDIPDPAELVTVDLSFISTAKVLPALVPLARPGADFLVLVKPQFELQRKEIGRGGIVRDAELHEKAIERVRGAALECGLEVFGVKPSRLTGAEGNQEFFLFARRKESHGGKMRR